MLVFTSKLPTQLLQRCKPNFSAIFRCEKYSQITDKEKTAVKFAHLGHRQIISLEGRDASTFLQGIVTNDVTLLPEMKCMYGMILNQHGRVLYDVIMYHQKSDKFDKIFVECEKESVESLIKTLKLYKLRKKLTITPQENVKILQADASDLERTFNPTSGEILALNSDPRVPLLGHRILVENMSEDNVDITWDLSNYHHRRYITGIPEGIADLPPGNCLPLESNLDYMNGVSFHKGCYIGQELTARTKFTGVIRKRLLPVTIEGKGQIEPGETIYNPKGRSAGKFRSMHQGGDVGLALVRLNYAEEALTTKNGDFVLQAHSPTWWPFKDGTEFSDGVCGPNVEENV